MHEQLTEQVLAELSDGQQFELGELLDRNYDRLPTASGIYLIGFQLERYGGGPLSRVHNWTAERAVLYVGETVNIRRRFGEHVMKLAGILEASRRGEAGADVSAQDFFVIAVPCPAEDRLILERIAIQALAPIANGAFGGDYEHLEAEDDETWTLIGRCVADDRELSIIRAVDRCAEPPWLKRYPGMAERLPDLGP